MNKEIEIKYRDDPMEIQMIDLPNKKCASEPLKHRYQAKRSPDYSASQDKEMMIKLLKIEYINIHKEQI
jgi:hypothetical protein